MRRPRAWILSLGCLFAVCALGGIFLILSSTHSIHLSTSQIQAELDKKFPIEKSDLAYRYRFSHPVFMVDRLADRLTLAVDADATALGSKTVHGHLGVNGIPRYETTTGNLYLDQPQAIVSDLDFSGLPEDLRRPASALLAAALEEYMRREPIYHVDDKQLLLVRRALRSVTVEKDGIRIDFGL